MTLKKDPNFEDKLTFYLKNDMGNSVNFNRNSGKSENLHFDWLICRKYVKFELKRNRGVALRKMTYGFKNDISNLVNVHISS